MLNIIKIIEHSKNEFYFQYDAKYTLFIKSINI